MKRTQLCVLTLCLVLLLPALAVGHSKDERTESYLNNRAPLVEKPYMALPLGAINAEGWLLEQLLRMKEGMTGHLDELYPKVMGERNG